MKLELVYFPVRARTEVICMCLRYGKHEYTCKSVAEAYGEGWGAAVKEKTPWGQAPILFVDGEPVAQSGTLVRFAAGISGLTPTDPLAAAKCDAIFEATQDASAINPIVNVYTVRPTPSLLTQQPSRVNPPPPPSQGDLFLEKKAALLASMPATLNRFTRHLGDGPFFLGAKPYYCDLAVYHIVSHVRLVDPALLADHDTLKLHMAAVEALPGVKEYLAERPDCVGIGTKPMLKPKEI